MTALECQSVECRFGNFRALTQIDLTVAKGEFITFLGPSGSGKSTLLNVVAGFIKPDDGRVMLHGSDVTATPARQRNIGMVFQSYALFPHMSIFENVAFGLRVRRQPRREILRRVGAILDLLQISELRDRFPAQLSGGQQQRVAVARVLVVEPSLLLFDEPFAALDRKLRTQVQLELRALHRKIGGTTIFVTHDQDEALLLSDRIAIMNQGKIEQFGTGEELYERPTNSFVAGFLGQSNLLPGTVRSVQDGVATIELDGFGVTAQHSAAPNLKPGDPANLLVRFDQIEIGSADGLPAQVEEKAYLGDRAYLKLRLENGTALECETRSERLANLTPVVSVSWANRGRIVRRETKKKGNAA